MEDQLDSIKLAFDDVERLADELRLAQELQRSMMPKLPPVLDQFGIAATWLPANEMSGDFYDFVPIDQDRWGIVLGDVTGKGMSAAMVMALTRSALRMAVKTSSSPTSVLGALNQQLLGDVAQRKPVALTYAVLDSYQRTLTITNAGIPYPLMLTSSGECVEIEVGGFPLGSTKLGFDYVDKVIELPSNSAIVLYSDGIDEARNDMGETYGFSRLPGIVSDNIDLDAKDLADLILQDVLNYTGESRYDDMTLVVIKAKEAVAAEDQKENRAYQLAPENLRAQMRKEQGKIEGERKVVTVLNVDFAQAFGVDNADTVPQGQRGEEPPVWSVERKSQPTLLPEYTVPGVDTIKQITDAIAQIIFKHGGLVNRASSNEISGFFGAPISHINDAEQAIHAAIEIRDALLSMSEGWGSPFEVKTALHTGTVVVSDISDETVEYSQVDPRFKTVQALGSNVKPGEIWVDTNTYKLTHANFDYSLLPPIEMERAGSSLQPYRLCGRRTPRHIRRSGDTFLQHESQRRRLQVYASELIAKGTGRIVSLVGSAGIGKNQLMAQFRERLMAQFRERPEDRVLWVTSRCAPEKRQSSYAVFVPILEHILNIDSSLSMSDLKASLRAELEALHNNAAIDWVFSVDEMQAYLEFLLLVDGQFNNKTAFLPYEQLQRQTFVAIRDVLVAAARRKPIVLALDDLLWIDDVSKNLIIFLLDAFSDTPIILLCLSYSQDWWLRDSAMKIVPDRYESIMLEWMSLEESTDLLDHLTPGEGMLESLKTLILHRANRNPFHLSQIVKLLLADGILIRHDNKWLVTAEVDSISIPNTLEGVLRARIDRLNFNAREIIQYASVLSVILSLDLLRKMADFIPHLDYHLQNLQNLGLIQYQPTDDELSYRLERALIANIVYASIPEQERMAHHDWIAQTLEAQTTGRMAEHYELLAFHYSRSYKVSKAIEYLTKAGHRARRCFNNTDAIDFYEQALDLLRNTGQEAPEEMWEIHDGLGDVFHAIGRYNDALTSYNKLFDLSEENDPSAQFAQADIKHRIAEVYIHQSAWNDALESLKSAQEILEQLEDLTGEGSTLELLGEICNHLGYVYSQQGDLTQAIHAGQGALTVLPESATPNLLARVHGRLGSYYTKTGDLKSAEGHLQAGVEYAERVGARDLLSIFYNDLGVIARASNYPGRAIECYQKSIRIEKQLKYLNTLSRSYLSLALVYQEIEELEDARLHLHNALKYAAHGSSDKFIGDVHVYLARIYQQQGHTDLAIEHYEKNIEVRMQADDEIGCAIGGEYLCQAYLAKGDIKAALEAGTASLKTAEMLVLDTLVARNYMNLAQIYRAKQDWEAAIENLEIALVVAGKAEDEGMMAQIHRRLAEIYLQSEPGYHADGAYLARTHFYEAMDLLGRTDADDSAIEEIRQIMEEHGLV